MEEEYDDNPGAVFIYNKDDEIHNLLALPSVANILPPLQQGRKKFYYYKLYKIYTLYNYIYIFLHVGGTSQQSRNNLHSWLDSIAMSISGGDCLVYSNTRRRIPGLYREQNCTRNSSVKLHNILYGMQSVRMQDYRPVSIFLLSREGWGG